MLEWLYIQPDLLLFAVAAALYVYDLATPLSANEILIYRSGTGTWVARTASQCREFGKRYLAFVRPLQPGTTIVRATWPRTLLDDADRGQALGGAVCDVERRLRFLRYQSTLLLLAIFAGLPFLCIFFGATALLAGIALVYAQALVMVASLLAKRRKLNLPWRSIAFILFESLICIPCAINLYRKIADRLLPIGADPIDLAEALLDAERSALLRRDLLQSLDQRIALSNGRDAKQNRLRRYRHRLLEQGAA